MAPSTHDLTRCLTRILLTVRVAAKGLYALRGTEPHPKFPNPTIAEAACEITFLRASDAPWSSGELYKLLQDEFPEIQPIGNMALQIVIGPVTPPAPIPPPGVPTPAFRFASAAGDRFVQVSDSNFICTVVGKYPGWEVFKKSILDHWNKIMPVIGPKEIKKLGLRYINRIKLNPDKTHLSDWLRPTDDLPLTFIRSRGHFLGRLESTPEPNSLKLITIGPQNPAADAPNGAIIFDIDRIQNSACEPGEIALGAALEKLHGDIWTVFSNARTEALEQRLQGRI
jgi:uncharacterized protein (TIGR04255 family)